MAEESGSNIWTIAGTIAPILLLAWAWMLYTQSGAGESVIGNYRMGEDAIWMFASAFLLYFSYGLMTMSKGGALEKGFLGFMISFFIIFLWKFIGVNERALSLPKGGLHEFKEMLEGLSGLAIGITYLYMYNVLRPKK
ncbi:MAG: hypothetical protein D6733_01505 [Methanobacteriota archaeon]|nr:MAG: hypothetical protein D6733_01505 [Euryarchaeota archaeon]